MQYFSQVAWHLHKPMLNKLPDSFVTPLVEFIRLSHSHIATLNYDNLLYQALIEAGVLAGYNGALVDGFLSSGFAADNLERKYGNTFGWYLHLHGTPLFVDSPTGEVFKQPQGGATCYATRHLVLTHVKHKPSVIDSSEVLREYWRRLAIALEESGELIVFGYSGTDEHLNTLIRSTVRCRKRVIEWYGAGAHDDRARFWTEQLGDVALIQLPSVLDFTSWEAV